jgi:hypothetical protein
MELEELTIVIEFDCVIIAGVSLPHSPGLQEVLNLMPSTSAREYRKDIPYLPTLILDDLGLVLRYREETKNVALVDVYFAVSKKRGEPTHPFPGTIVLNQQALRRPFPFNKLKASGVFSYDDKPVPAAGSSRIGVSITPKFEYIGIINFGWKVD